VALKIARVNPVKPTGERERFERGLRLARNLSHPTSFPVIDGGADEKQYWVATELQEAVNLEEHLTESPSVRLGDMVSVIGKACRGVAFMHEKNLVHRDIRPTKILICRDGKVKLTGFAMVKEHCGGQALTVLGQVITVPHYMSPEQCLCAKIIDHRSDVYSMGCVLYQIVCRHPPFTHEDCFQVILAHVKENRAPSGTFAGTARPPWRISLCGCWPSGRRSAPIPSRAYTMSWATQRFRSRRRTFPCKREDGPARDAGHKRPSDAA